MSLNTDTWKLLEQILERDGEINGQNAPKDWLQHAKKLEATHAALTDEMNEAMTALGKRLDDACAKVKVLAEIESEHVQMCTALQECVQRHGIGLGGEKLDALVVSQIDGMREAIKEAYEAIIEARDCLFGETSNWAIVDSSLPRSNPALAKLQEYLPAKKGGAA